MCTKLARLLLLAVAVVGYATPPAYAIDPNRPIQILVGYAPGGPLDSIARTIAPHLSEILKQPVVVQNRPGASGVIANQAVAQSSADENLLSINGITHSILPSLMKEMPYDTLKDFTNVALIGYSPLIVVTAPDSPFKTLLEAVDYAKKNPDGVAFASGGAGSSMHLAMEMLKGAAKINLLHVQYKGSIPALQDVMTGRVQLLADVATTSLPRVKQGQVRALAVTGPERMSELPDVPTVTELGYPQMDFVTWWGIFGPADMPAQSVERLNAALQTTLKNPEVQRTYASLGGTPTSSSSAEFTKLVESDFTRFQAVIKDANITK